MGREGAKKFYIVQRPHYGESVAPSKADEINLRYGRGSVLYNDPYAGDKVAYEPLLEIIHVDFSSAQPAAATGKDSTKSPTNEKQAAEMRRRTVMVDLTPDGQKLALKLRATVVERWTKILSGIPSEDAEKYLEILKKISEAL